MTAGRRNLRPSNLFRHQEIINCRKELHHDRAGGTTYGLLDSKFQKILGGPFNFFTYYSTLKSLVNKPY